MAQRCDTDMLTSGLRALGILARYAPVAVDDLARLSGTSSQRALTLVEAFIQCGYVARFADTSAYVLTEQALGLVPFHGNDRTPISVH